jgi:tetratricopeptide (TPR) repeat protein
VERLSWEWPRDPRVLTIFGRVMLAWPAYGRFQADSLLTRAGELDPDNPEPFYYLGLVGIALRGDDGEWVARRGLTRVLALEPTYRDAWTRWSRLYRGEDERRAGVTALALHTGEPTADLWRAQLLLELGAYDEAQPVLEGLVSRTPADPAPRALLAQLLYETGRDESAEPVYEEALARAAADTGSVLWRQVRSAASPAEREAYRRTPPEGRTAFFRRLWAFRRPDLRARVNGRIGEHFRRLRDARLTYPLLHPNSLYFHSRTYRGSQRIGGGDMTACLREASPSRVDVAVPLVMPARPADLDETLNLEDGLDDRGRIFVRYGAPDERVACGVAEETWRYRLREGLLQVTFQQRSEGTGDALVAPVAAGEWQAAQWLLATDRPGGEERLDLAFWTAAFRGRTRWETDLVVRPDSVSALAVLTDAAGREIVRDSATDALLHLAAAAGRYLFAVDATRGDSLGRFRSTITLPSFSGDSLAVSDLLVTDRDAPAERDAMVAAAPARLRVARDRPLRVYAEVYGLATVAGRSRYDAEYRFEPVGERSAARRTVVRFRREQPARSITIESLVVDPGRLAPGRYRVWIQVRDATLGRRAASASLEIELY